MQPITIINNTIIEVAIIIVRFMSVFALEVSAPLVGVVGWIIGIIGGGVVELLGGVGVGVGVGVGSGVGVGVGAGAGGCSVCNAEPCIEGANNTKLVNRFYSVVGVPSKTM